MSSLPTKRALMRCTSPLLLVILSLSAACADAAETEVRDQWMTTLAVVEPDERLIPSVAPDASAEVDAASPSAQPTAPTSNIEEQVPTVERATPPTYTPVSPASNRPRAGEIKIILEKDAIPAILDPKFLSVAEASTVYHDDEAVLGIEINGEAHAYSVPWLSRVEIVNDVVGGRKIAVTW